MSNTCGNCGNRYFNNQANKQRFCTPECGRIHFLKTRSTTGRFYRVSSESLYAVGQIVEEIGPAQMRGHLHVKTTRGNVYDLPKSYLQAIVK